MVIRFVGVDITLPGTNDPKVKLIDRRHVVPPLHIYKYKESDSNNAGIDYTEGNLPKYTLTAGMPKDLGLLLKCAPYVLLKRGDVSDWATFGRNIWHATQKRDLPLS